MKIYVGIIVLLVLAGFASAQGNGTKARPKEVLLDPDGNVISNNEWRDYSLSDPQRKDPFKRTVRADGTVELRLNRNPFEGSVAPEFSVKTLDGATLDAAALKSKVVVLSFWFIGCPGCREEIPSLNKLAAKHAADAGVVFISLANDPPDALARFTADVPFAYRQVAQAREVAALFGIRTFPRNIVIGRDGKIVYWRSTVAAWDQFDRVIHAELEKPAAGEK